MAPAGRSPGSSTDMIVTSSAAAAMSPPTTQSANAIGTATGTGTAPRPSTPTAAMNRAGEASRAARSGDCRRIRSRFQPTGTSTRTAMAAAAASASAAMPGSTSRERSMMKAGSTIPVTAQPTPT